MASSLTGLVTLGAAPPFAPAPAPELSFPPGPSGRAVREAQAAAGALPLGDASGPHPCPAGIHPGPQSAAPRLTPGCQLCSRKPAPPKAGIRLNEHWAGRPGPASLDSSLGVRGNPGLP